ncbi:TetR/AcrR family transcriptional regulator [uncultured Aquimarina sp.]|uniref:TetR/AcrR family transcriptional regulator n=1 Tax=uncultured Aquimarina sp. TaxID=575652 RepID=UPI0026334F03|nr:TetR/AcrR family transcriptional regulator [uncultured Aquimarina sp.]
MTSKSLGRPTNDELILSKDHILKVALKVLDEQGEIGLSFRKLANVFGVTAMALKHHVGSRQDIIKSLVEVVYKNVNEITITDDSKEVIRALLDNYCKCVFKHPNVSRLLLIDHSLINKELIELTNSIRKHAISLVNDETEGILLADLIVDYTHGFALAAASQNEKTDLGVLTINDFYKGIDWIFARV